MSDYAAHKTQAEHNRNLLEEEILRREDTPYPDWVVTVAFYTALHLVEEKLAKKNLHVRSGGHDTRRRLVHRHLGQISTLYETLHEDSQAVRYDCLPMDA